MATAPGPDANPVLDEDFDPCTDDDIQQILKEEKSSSQDEGWMFMKKTDECEIWRKKVDDKPVHLIKAFLSFPGIPHEKIVELVHDFEVRTKWDKVFPTIDVIETHKHYRVVYWVLKMPAAVTNRDVVSHVSKRRDEATSTTYILYKNATHPKCPEKKGMVRAELLLSGTIVRPDPDDPGSTKMCVFLQNDVKGKIPHSSVNTFVSRAPAQTQKDIVNYYRKHYLKEGETVQTEKPE